jgi:hypothetical protein
MREVWKRGRVKVVGGLDHFVKQIPNLRKPHVPLIPLPSLIYTPTAMKKGITSFQSEILEEKEK